MTDGFVVVAEFDLSTEHVDEFVRLVRDNASASVRDESGCRRFDVLVPEKPEPGGGTLRILLYEIYRDADAFDAHLRTPHFKRFQADTAALVTGRAVRRFDLYENAKSV